MSAPLRFLGFAVLAWVGVRAASLGLFPGATALAPPAKAAVPPLAASSAGQPAQQSQPAPYPAYPAFPYAPYPPYPSAAPQPPIILPAGWGTPRFAPVIRVVAAPAAAPVDYPGWTLVRAAADPGEPGDRWESSPPPPVEPRGGGGLASAPPPPGPPRLDRWSLSAWALMRDRPGASSLATGGTLGGSQAGARLTYRFTPAIAASLRFSSGISGVRDAEAAAGIRVQPLRNIPVAFTVERREGIGKWGGRSAFAAFAEGGLYHRPIAGRVLLDDYAQAGVVGIRSRDWFADGGLTLSHPLWRNLSGGFGMWGGAQPGLYRLDAGPRVTLDLGRGIRVHGDYRQRLVGNAAPPSGPALTIAADW